MWLNGLGVWFSLWVREVPGSNPGWALIFLVLVFVKGWRKNCYCMPWPGFEPGLLRPQRRVLTTIRSRLQGLIKTQIIFWRVFSLTPYIFVSTPGILYHSESPTLQYPWKCVEGGEAEGGSKGHYLAVSQKSVINSKTTLSYLLYPSSCVYQYTLEVPMHW